MFPKLYPCIKINTSINYTKNPIGGRGINLDSNMDRLRADGDVINGNGIIFPYITMPLELLVKLD